MALGNEQIGVQLAFGRDRLIAVLASLVPGILCRSVIAEFRRRCVKCGKTLSPG